MSAGPDSGDDLVAVACVVEASLLLASEWSRILIEYVSPLLVRLSELHPSHQIRMALVSYGAADTRPMPILTKKFFVPLSRITKELREEPSRLGIGQTSSGSGRGLSALEGLVAGIELFDMLMMSANYLHASTQPLQKEGKSLISHLLHIVASPPDHAQRPQWNTLQHLDSVNWDTIPLELKRRKINLSLISLKKIPQFQDLQSLVAGTGAQSPWFNVRAPHVLSLAGFPLPQKTGTKRQTDALLSDQSPDMKRQKLVTDPTSKTSSASPALSSARIPQSQRPQTTTSSQIPQPPPTTIPSHNPSSTQPVQPPPSVPESTPATATPVPPPPSGPSIPLISSEVLDQAVAPTGLKFGQMMERLKALERDIAKIELKVSNAQSTGQVAVLAGLQKDLAPKIHVREQIRLFLRQHYQKAVIAKEASSLQASAIGSAPPNGTAEAGPSAPSYSSNAPSASGPSSERPTGSATEERKPAVSGSQILAQLWQSRGGTISTPSGSNPQAGSSQTQSPLAVTPEVVPQMQKLADKKVIQPPSVEPSVQASATASRETGVNPNATNNQVFIGPAWQGTFSWTFPKLNSQVVNATEMQIYMVGAVVSPGPGDVRIDSWPKNLSLNPCKEPLKDNMELQLWVKRHRPRSHLMRFAPNPRAPDGSANEQRFQTLHKFMADHRIYAYIGWQLPSGKFSYNIVIFPVPSSFAGTMFPDGIPDLPGSGNALDAQALVGEAKPQPSSGIDNLPAGLWARMQGLDLAQRKQLLAYFVQEQLRRQQSQQNQQPHATSSQILNSSGISIPPNSYGTVGNIPAGLNTNPNGLMSSGTHNTGSGTVNYEMMQSFMQRNAEGSTSTQGINPGQIP